VYSDEIKLNFQNFEALNWTLKWKLVGREIGNWVCLIEGK